MKKKSLRHQDNICHQDNIFILKKHINCCSRIGRVLAFRPKGMVFNSLLQHTKFFLSEFKLGVLVELRMLKSYESYESIAVYFKDVIVKTFHRSRLFHFLIEIVSTLNSI